MADQGSQNPYAPPATSDAPLAAGHVQDTQPQPKMPGSVLTVIIFVGLFILFYLISLRIGQAVVAGLILAGLIKGHALAWQWGRIIPILGGISALLGLAVLSNERADSLVVVITVGILIPIAGLMFAIPFLLGTKRARLFFRLRCPSCQSMKVKAADFLFTTRRCGACKVTWK